MSEIPFNAVILAAGMGTRMRSSIPKVLHPLCGRPMIDHVLMACAAAGARRVTVVVNPDHGSLLPHLDEAAAELGVSIEPAFQDQPRGTGHAVMQVAPHGLEDTVLIVNADNPCITAGSLRRLVETLVESGADAVFASCIDPSRSDGRVVRDAAGGFLAIVEHSDATAGQRAIAEINTGLYCFRGPALARGLAGLRPSPVTGELYLTAALAAIGRVEILRLDDPEEAMGVNDRVQLARAEAVLRRRIAERHMRAGVTIRDPATTFIDDTVSIGPDTVIEPFTFLTGRTAIAGGCRVGPYAQVTDCELEEGVILERAHVAGSRFAAGSDCGPFARVRPGSEVGPRAHIGSFGEIVRSRLGPGARVPHFSYVGDAEIGAGANFAAGSITANWDGVDKHSTRIGEGAFIGVDTMLVAPVVVGARARTGAGSVVLHDVPDGATVAGVPARRLTRSSPVEPPATGGGQGPA